MSDPSRPGFGASKAGVRPEKRASDPVYRQQPGSDTPPYDMSLGRRNSSDACAHKSLIIDPLDSILAKEPESPPPRWDMIASTAALSSPDITPTPSPGGTPMFQNRSSSSSCIPSAAGTKARRPDSESQCLRRRSSIFSPDRTLKGDEEELDDDDDDAPACSRIKPPDSTPAGEKKDGADDDDGDGLACELRRTSSAPIGRPKR